MAPSPLTILALEAFSVADDLAYVGLNDFWRIANARNDHDSRLIGGNMVTLHVLRWQLGPGLLRESQDIDIGVSHAVARDPSLIEDLIAVGYARTAGNRFEKPVKDLGAAIEGVSISDAAAAIEILIPPATSRARDNVRIGNHLTSTEVRGLPDALRREGVPLKLRLRRLNGETLEAGVLLADEVSAIVMKAFAWQTTGRGTDAVDIWRMLEVAAAAKIEPETLLTGRGPQAVQIIRDAFEPPRGLAMQRLRAARGLNQIAGDRLHTRISALILEVLPPN